MSNASTSCVFCRMVAGNDPQAKILYRDEQILIIADRSPLARHHILVLPCEHIENAKQLRAEHVPLVEYMNKAGLEKMQELGADMGDLRSGMNWPPLNTVSHLHQHFIAPGQQLGFLRSWLFSQRNPFFVNTHYLLKRLYK